MCCGLSQPAWHGLAEHSHPGPQRMPYSPPGSHMGSAEARGADRVTLFCTAVQPRPLLAKVRQWRWQESQKSSRGQCGAPEKKFFTYFPLLILSTKIIINKDQMHSLRKKQSIIFSADQWTVPASLRQSTHIAKGLLGLLSSSIVRGPLCNFKDWNCAYDTYLCLLFWRIIKQSTSL